MSIYGVPFNEERVRNDGASSFEEFREWVLEYGDNFLHSLSNLQNGDIIVFGWMEGNGEWKFVGDAIVKQNHKTGSVDWCDCEPKEESGFSRHIVTGGVRLYPKSVSSKEIKSLKLGQFAKLTWEQYEELVGKSVSHWR
ncbi:MAG: hypothetical protein ACP5NO_03685 [Thermoplasmata archaeon]